MKIRLALCALASGLLLATGASAKTDATQAGAPTRGLYLQLIRQARADGRPRAAIAYLDDFDRQFPRDRDAGLLRVNSLLDLGQVDEAEAAFATLSRTGASAKDAAAIDAAHGHVLAARGRWSDAVPAYSSAVAADPTSPVLRNALGYALLRAHRTDAAIEALRGAADLAPDDAIIRNNLILAYAVDGQTLAVAQAIAHVADRRAQGELRRQIAQESARIAAPASVPAAPIAAPPNKKERR